MTELEQVTADPIRRSLLAGECHDFVPATREHVDREAPDAAGRTGDNCHLAIKPLPIDLIGHIDSPAKRLPMTPTAGRVA